MILYERKHHWKVKSICLVQLSWWTKYKMAQVFGQMKLMVCNTNMCSICGSIWFVVLIPQEHNILSKLCPVDSVWLICNQMQWSCHFPHHQKVVHLTPVWEKDYSPLYLICTALQTPFWQSCHFPAVVEVPALHLVLNSSLAYPHISITTLHWRDIPYHVSLFFFFFKVSTQDEDLGFSLFQFEAVWSVNFSQICQIFSWMTTWSWGSLSLR